MATLTFTCDLRVRTRAVMMMEKHKICLSVSRQRVGIWGEDMSDAFILYSSQGTFLAHNKLDVFLVQITEHY